MNEVQRFDAAADDDLAIGQRHVEDEDVHIDCLDTAKYSPLARAVLEGQHAAVYRLLGPGSDVSIVLPNGQTLLAAAIQHGHDAIARLLYPKMYPGPVSAAADEIVLGGVVFPNASSARVTEGTYKGKTVVVKSPRLPHDRVVRGVRKKMQTMQMCGSPYLTQLLAVLDNGSMEPHIVAPSRKLFSPAMIMDSMDQGGLDEYIQKKKHHAPVAMNVSTTDVALVVARALADLHRNGFTHRDVKSQNIFLSTTHYIRLGNIGSGHDENAALSSNVGATHWLAPEVLRVGYEQQAYAADIYALGVILTELDTLQMPYYDVEDRWSIEEKVRTGQLRPHMSDTCPPWLNDLANQCLAFDPAERPTAAAIVAQLLLHRDAPTEDDSCEALDATLPAESPSTLMDLTASAQRLHAMGLEMRLYTAANNGDLDDVNDLLQRGVDPSCCESFLHRTPLHSASLRGDVAMVASLLAAGANVNASDAKACSLLHLAALHGHFDVAARLLQANADLSFLNQSGVTAAAVARTRGHLALAKRLDDATTNAAP